MVYVVGNTIIISILIMLLLILWTISVFRMLPWKRENCPKHLVFEGSIAANIKQVFFIGEILYKNQAGVREY